MRTRPTSASLQPAIRCCRDWECNSFLNYCYVLGLPMAPPLPSSLHHKWLLLPCRSFHLLDEVLDEALEGVSSGDEAAAGKVQDRMAVCQNSLLSFEASIRACLRMEPISI